MEIENLRDITERGSDFLLRPNIKRPFSVLRFPVLEKAIGIFSRKKSAFLACQVASDVIENVPCDGFIPSIVRDLKGVEISGGELRLIVEHFLEVRHVLVTIDRVAMKTAAEMIVHSAGGHFAQSEQSHFERLFTGFALGITPVESR